MILTDGDLEKLLVLNVSDLTVMLQHAMLIHGRLHTVENRNRADINHAPFFATMKSN